MHVEMFPTGRLQTNCYVVSCVETKEAVIIDPGMDFEVEAQPVFKYVDEEKLRIKFIVNTHGHQDHINSDILMQKKYSVPICIHEQDAYFIECLGPRSVVDVLLKDGGSVVFGNVCLKVMHAPGHSRGGICLVGDGVMFSGDTLFAECIGRTDFVESSPKDMVVTLRKIVDLPDGLLVYPGHDEVTVLGKEKLVNPFLVNLKL